MFKKIISQLSFSPALVGQLSFYAKRLRKEQATRRLGLVFVALALVVQSLVVFQAPEPANASNAGDMVQGGLGLGSARSLDKFLNPYDRNDRNLKDVMNYFGITREEITATYFGQYTVGEKIVWGYENRPSAKHVAITNSNGVHVNNLYGRPQNMAETRDQKIWGYIGHSKKIGWFAIQQWCGNLITDIYPPVPTPPPAPANVSYTKTAVNKSRGSVDATKVAAQENNMITFTLSARNTGGTAQMVSFNDNISSVLKFAKLVDRNGATLSSNNTLSWPSASVGPGRSTSRSFTVQINPSLVSSMTNCQITNTYGGSTVVLPVECKKPASIGFSKSAVNNSRGNVDASKVAAQENNKITYTISATNTGGVAKAVAFTDNLSSVLNFSKLTNRGGGTLGSNNVLSWGNVNVAPGQTVSRSYVVQLNPSLVTTQVNCKMVNNFQGKTVTVPVECKTPANIVANKTAKNISRGNVDATKVVAQENNKITYTVTVRNTGGTDESVELKDDLSDVLPFAKLANAGGGKLNSAKVLSWGNVNVKAGATVTKTYTIQVNSSLVTTQTNCKMVNNFLNKTVTIPVECKKPANISSSKTAINTSRGNVEAAKVTAQEGNKITYTIKVANSGGVSKAVDLKDDLSDVLAFSSLVNNGGGKLNNAKTLSWGTVNVGAGQTISKSYTIQLNSSLITTQTNCKITNKFLSNSVVVPVGCKKPANITGSKSAINVTRGKVDATKVTAQENNKITYTVKISNTGGSPKEVSLNDDLSSVLKWSKLTNAGGGKLNSTSNVLSWGKVNVNAGQTITKSYTVQLNSSLVTMEKNCKMVNDFLDKSVVVPVGCSTPPAEIFPSKTALNLTQGNVDATTIAAKASDRISFTLVAENKGGTAKDFVFEDNIGDLLEYATVVDKGGATYDDKTRKLSWPTITLNPGEKQTRVFTAQLLATIPSTPKGLSDPTSYNCKIENTFYTSSVTINVTCPGPKVIENVVPQLPQTGAGENIIFAGLLLAIVSFFYFRSRQLGTEVRLIRRDLNGGTI